MNVKEKDTATSIGLLLLRLGFGLFLASHGWGKVQMAINGEWDKFADPVGMGNKMSLIAAAGAEFGCALLVAIGLLTRFAAIPAAFTMGVAAFVVHGSDPLSSETAAKAFMAGTSKSWASKEPALLYMIAFLTLVFTGAGKISLDALLFRRRRRTEVVPNESP